jgi:hypothetical protein
VAEKVPSHPSLEINRHMTPYLCCQFLQGVDDNLLCEETPLI